MDAMSANAQTPAFRTDTMAEDREWVRAKEPAAIPPARMLRQGPSPERGKQGGRRRKPCFGAAGVLPVFMRPVLGKDQAEVRGEGFQSRPRLRERALQGTDLFAPTAEQLGRRFSERQRVRRALRFS